jgi:dynein heavy chain
MEASFNREWTTVVTLEPLLYGSFIPTIVTEEGKPPLEDIYCELTNRETMVSKMEECLEFYNQINPVKMNLVLFMNAIEHVLKIVRII